MPIDGENLFSDKIRKRIAVQNCKSKANGGLMRISTLIVWFYYKNKNIIRNDLNSNDPKIFLNLYLNIYKEVQKDFEITHPNKENIVSGALLFFMTLCTMNKHGGNETIKKLFILLENDLFMKNGDENLLNNLIKNTLNEVNREQFNRSEYFKSITKNMGYYVHAFKLVLYYLSVIDKRNKNEDNIYLKIIQEICDYGGDTDTNAAIVGTVIGPLIGYLNFTKDHLFQNMVQFYYPSRILYTSSLMYFYVEFLDDYFNKNIIQKESGIKFNTLKILLEMLTKNIK
jgi:ADP-ribosylglycohydrolase